jgi:hypothetical protein
MFDPDADMLRPNCTLVDLGACIIADLRLARERQVTGGILSLRQIAVELADDHRPPREAP